MREIHDIDELRQRLAAAEELNAQLERALESRVVIEQAKGVLAERLGVRIDEAFEILRSAARTSRTGLHQLAVQVINEPRTPNPVVVALARRPQWRSALLRERNDATLEISRELGRLSDDRR